MRRVREEKEGSVGGSRVPLPEGLRLSCRPPARVRREISDQAIAGERGIFDRFEDGVRRGVLPVTEFVVLAEVAGRSLLIAL